MKRVQRQGVPSPRNPVARSPLLRKGGVHEKSTGARRRQARMALQRQLRERHEDDSGG